PSHDCIVTHDDSSFLFGVGDFPKLPHNNFENLWICSKHFCENLWAYPGRTAVLPCLLIPKIAVTIFFTHKPFFLHSKTPQVIAMFFHFAKTPEKICRPL
ncbi:MAG: hypothetical protein IKY67_09455, partial [Paludibacteraceae bacterium]|nr:hypothetical protein [Paludibacteraceae bacterium]